MDGSCPVKGNEACLKSCREHPYIERNAINTVEDSIKIIDELNISRDNGRGPNVEVEYYFEVDNDGQPMDGLKKAAKMLLEHGTLKPWHKEGDINIAKPAGYDDHMSWATGLKLLGYNRSEGVEAGLVTIAYPLAFFDKTADGSFPLTRLMMAIAGEPFSAFSFYRGAKIVDVKIPDILKKRLPGIKWPHGRIRRYLNINPSDPIIGTIVKPKTGLTPGLFSNAVVEAALAGARFTKADENMHLSLKELPGYVERTVNDLRKAGFDLGKEKDAPKGPRFLFAPHITSEPGEMMEYAKAAVQSGANALMFSPYYGGGFQKLAEIAEIFDVPVYSHTAGMNVYTGAHNWGIDSNVMYRFAAYFGAAFMQLTAINGYLKPDDTEKRFILEKLKSENLEGNEGMTLVIAGGIGPQNIGENIKELGLAGKMFLAGTSVYSHPDGPASGVKAILLAYRAYCEERITGIDGLIKYGKALGIEGKPLVNALI